MSICFFIKIPPFAPIHGDGLRGNTTEDFIYPRVLQAIALGIDLHTSSIEIISCLYKAE